MAVAMIFYPIEFKGWRLKVWPGQPFGLFGWTGIVPCKAQVLATRMVRMMTTSLIDVDQVECTLKLLLWGKRIENKKKHCGIELDFEGKRKIPKDRGEEACAGIKFSLCCSCPLLIFLLVFWFLKRCFNASILISLRNCWCLG
jgi:hypothetical protein